MNLHATGADSEQSRTGWAKTASGNPSSGFLCEEEPRGGKMREKKGVHRRSTLAKGGAGIAHGGRGIRRGEGERSTSDSRVITPPYSEV